ncbi:MAG: hypothetical protein M0R76_12870 [Proteobacteria bacterium]|nr:hypothetical protein [Pseudomonadota bacterium]
MFDRSSTTLIWRAALLLTCFGALAACDVTSETAPTLHRVVPDEVVQGAAVDIELQGSGFHPLVSRNVDCGGRHVVLDADFVVRLRPVDSDDAWQALAKVTWVDFDRLTTTVPQTAKKPWPAGRYDVQLQTPDGHAVLLPGALTVVGAAAQTDTDPEDTGPEDTGPEDTGPEDTGPEDTGPEDTGPEDTGPEDTGPEDTGPEDTGPEDTGPVDTETVDTETVDTVPIDTDPVDTETVDTVPIDTDPVDTDTVDTDTVDTDPVDTDTVDTDTVDTDTEDTDTEDTDTGTDTEFSTATDDAAFALAPPTIDGNLNETMWRVNTAATQCIAGVCDNTVTFDALWDLDYLYIGVTVRDAYIFVDAPDPRDNDAIEIFIDGDYSASLEYDIYDKHFVRGASPASPLLSLNGSDTGVLHAARTTANGYAMEFAVPWTLLDAVPYTGMSIGFDLGNYDVDAAQSGRLMWSGTASNDTSTRKFGTLTLIERSFEAAADETFPNSCGNPRPVQVHPYTANITWRLYDNNLNNGICTQGDKDVWYFVLLPTNKTVRVTSVSSPGVSLIMRRHNIADCARYVCQPIRVGTNTIDLVGGAVDSWGWLTVSAVGAGTTSVSQLTFTVQ